MTKQFSKVMVLDFETTGLKHKEDYPTEVGALLITPFGELEYNEFVKLPEGVEIPEFITKLTGLTTEKVNSEGKSTTEIKEALQMAIDNDTLVIAHNANFDLGFLKHHFDIAPRYFMCTRTIEIMTAPHLSASLADVFKRYFPEEDIEQTHRALDDCHMTAMVFDAQTGLLGDGMEFFLNTLVSMPDRPVQFVPKGSKILDFTKKYVSERTHKKAVDRMEEAEFHIGELMGVMDNIHGDSYAEYDEAQKFMGEED